jgi:hypothetical protein
MPFRKQDSFRNTISVGEPALSVAMELHNWQWKFRFQVSAAQDSPSNGTLEARNLVALQEQIGQGKSRL